jgi:hypothetical protein
MENAVDVAHFACLHRTTTSSIKGGKLRIDGPSLHYEALQVFSLGLIGRWFGISKDVELQIRTLGLGFVCIYANKPGESLPETLVMAYPVPVDENRIKVSTYYSSRKQSVLTPLVEMLSLVVGQLTFNQDIPIWENKQYRPYPRLSPADGPILQFRRWAQQFY